MTEQHRRNRNLGVIDSKAENMPLIGMDNLQLWFRSDSLLPTLNDGDKVSAWTDDSGTGKNATQATEADQPIFKTNVINKKPSLEFTGGQFLDHTDVNYSLATYFIVWNKYTAGDDVVLGNASTTYAYLQFDDLWYVATGDSISVPMTLNTFFLKSCVYDGVNYQRYTNGSAEAPEAGTLPMQMGGVGAVTGEIIGSITEVVVFNVNLSDANRKIVEDYLNTKYALW